MESVIKWKCFFKSSKLRQSLHFSEACTLCLVSKEALSSFPSKFMYDALPLSPVPLKITAAAPSD